VPKAGKTRRGTCRITVPIGVNNPPHAVTVDPGDYTVRLYLPSGEIMAESVSVTPDSHGKSVSTCAVPRTNG
jgi:hypothetical protein